MNIKKGDNVKLLAGKDRGKTGKVMTVDAKAGKVSLEGLNLFKKHVRAKKQGGKGEVVEVARPVDISNVAVVCKACGKAARVGSRMNGEQKERFCAKCKATI